MNFAINEGNGGWGEEEENENRGEFERKERDDLRKTYEKKGGDHEYISGLEERDE